MRRAYLLGIFAASLGCESTSNLLRVPAEVSWVAVSTVDPTTAERTFSPLRPFEAQELGLYTPSGAMFAVVGYSDAQVLPLARFSPSGLPGSDPLRLPEGCEPLLPAPIYSVSVDATGQHLGPGTSDLLTASWISGAPQDLARLVVDTWCERAEPFSCELEADLRSVRIRGVERRCGLGTLSASYLSSGVLCASFSDSAWRCGPAASFVGGADLTCVRPGTNEACRARVLADSGVRELVVDRYYYSTAAPLPSGEQLGSAYDFAPLSEGVVVSLRSSAQTSTSAPPCDERPGTLVIVQPGIGTSSVSAPACLERITASGSSGFVGVYRERGWFLGRFDPRGRRLVSAPVTIAADDPLVLEGRDAHPVELLSADERAWVLWSRKDGSSVVTSHSATLELLSAREAPAEGKLLQLLRQDPDELAIVHDRGATSFAPAGSGGHLTPLSPAGPGARVLGAYGLGAGRIAVTRHEPTGLYVLDTSETPVAPVLAPAACYDVPGVRLTQVGPYPGGHPLRALVAGLTQDHIAVATYDLERGRFAPESIVTESMGIISRIKAGDSGLSVWMLNPLEHSLLRVHRRN